MTREEWLAQNATHRCNRMNARITPQACAEQQATRMATEAGPLCPCYRCPDARPVGTVEIERAIKHKRRSDRHSTTDAIIEMIEGKRRTARVYQTDKHKKNTCRCGGEKSVEARVCKKCQRAQMKTKGQKL